MLSKVVGCGSFFEATSLDPPRPLQGPSVKGVCMEKPISLPPMGLGR